MSESDVAQLAGMLAGVIIVLVGMVVGSLLAR